MLRLRPLRRPADDSTFTARPNSRTRARSFWRISRMLLAIRTSMTSLRNILAVQLENSMRLVSASQRALEPDARG